MRQRIICASRANVLLVALIYCLSGPLAAALPTGERTLAPMLDEVTPAVVNISTRSRVRVQENPLFSDPFFRRFFDLPERPRERQRQSLGSGVIVEARKGIILTNHHVVAKAEKITTTLADGRSFEAKLIGSDPEADIAAIQIDAKDLTALKRGDSNQLRVGDFVVAIGNPFGLGQTVTSGIVSALGRNTLGIEGYEDFIQTDAPINVGNSGGALVNLNGELVGINTAIIGPGGGSVGIGFAIPVNMASKVLDQLIEYGEVRRGQLGVAIQDLNQALARAFDIKVRKGAVIAQVIEDSPAEKAGLKPGDVVIRVDQEFVESAADLRNAIGFTRVGESVELEILRDGKRRTVRAVIESLEDTKLSSEALIEKLGGATFSDIERDHPLHGHVQGALVYKVQSESPAANAGLQGGDIITSVNRTPVRNLEEFREAVTALQGDLLLNVRRGRGAFFVLIR